MSLLKKSFEISPADHPLNEAGPTTVCTTAHFSDPRLAIGLTEYRIKMIKSNDLSIILPGTTGNPTAGEKVIRETSRNLLSLCGNLLLDAGVKIILTLIPNGNHTNNTIAANKADSDFCEFEQMSLLGDTNKSLDHRPVCATDVQWYNMYGVPEFKNKKLPSNLQKGALAAAQAPLQDSCSFGRQCHPNEYLTRVAQWMCSPALRDASSTIQQVIATNTHLLDVWIRCVSESQTTKIPWCEDTYVASATDIFYQPETDRGGSGAADDLIKEQEEAHLVEMKVDDFIAPTAHNCHSQKAYKRNIALKLFETTKGAAAKRAAKKGDKFSRLDVDDTVEDIPVEEDEPDEETKATDAVGETTVSPLVSGAAGARAKKPQGPAISAPLWTMRFPFAAGTQLVVILLLALFSFAPTTSAASVVLPTAYAETPGFQVWGSIGPIGNVVNTAGDINGDGFSDFVLGAPTAYVPSTPSARSTAGASYVVFGGKMDSASKIVDLYNLGDRGFVVYGGVASDNCGSWVSGAGDINNDGFDDVLIGEMRYDLGTRTDAGLALLIFGHSNSTPFVDIDLLTFISGAVGFKIYDSVSNGLVGASMAPIGDFNKDGYRDFIVAGSANAYVFFGREFTSPPGNWDMKNNGIGLKIQSMSASGPYQYTTGSQFVSGAGDVNGDGIDDILIGAYSSDALSRSGAGFVAVIYGKAGTFTYLDANQVTGSTGYCLYGAAAGDALGYSVGGLGDVNRDGVADFIISAYQADPFGRTAAGTSYVMFGRHGNVLSNIDLWRFNTSTTTGFRIYGAKAGDNSGFSVSSAGDLNDDGIPDILIGAPGYESSIYPYDYGATYLIYGRTTLGAADIDLSQLDSNPSMGYMIVGAASTDGSGKCVSKGGDVNGDGWADLLIGAYQGDVPTSYNGGITHVLLGGTIAQPQAGALTDLSLEGFASSASGGLLITGTNSFPLGSRMSGVGDVNGDGIDDIALTSHNGDPLGRSNAGIVYIIYGSRSLPDIDVTAFVSGPKGYMILGAAASDQMGSTSLSGAGDVNGDNVQDIIVGANSADPNGRTSAGTAYVVFGRSGTPATDIDLLTFATSGLGYRIFGSLASDNMGYTVSGLGDMNGDGFGDVLVTAPNADPSGNLNAGIAFILFGHTNADPFPDVNSTTFTSGVIGFRIIGGTARKLSSTVNGADRAGDFNGDGFSDVIIGTKYSAPFGRSNAGGACILFGRSGTAYPDVSLDALVSGSDAVVIMGAVASDTCGDGVASAGDTNGDGVDDIIIGCSGASPQGLNTAGTVYVVYGHRGAFRDIDLLSFANSTLLGYAIFGVDYNSYMGSQITGVGDVNRDGLDDIMVGNNQYPADGPGGTGATYLIFGQSNFTAAENIALAGLSYRPHGRLITGISGGRGFGAGVRSAGDFNGDGRPDIMVSAYEPGSGAVAILYNVSMQSPAVPAESSIDLGNFPVGFDGTILYGDSTVLNSGYSVSKAGDFNGDGVGDYIIGNYRATHLTRTNCGNAYVVYGKLGTTASSTIQISTLSSAASATPRATRIIGAGIQSWLGTSVSDAGDVNGDKIGDILLASFTANSGTGTNKAAVVFVIFGSNATTIYSDIDTLSFVSGPKGFKLYNIFASAYTLTVASAGDVNGDGFGDICVRASSNGVYVIFGHPGSTPFTDVNLNSLSSDTRGFLVSGFSAGAGDVNGDGYSDVIVGGAFNTGIACVMVIFGHSSATPFPYTYANTFVAGASGMLITTGVNGGMSFSGGATYYNTATGAGDINADGIEDIIIGCPSARDLDNNAYAGTVYIVFGTRTVPTGNLDLTAFSAGPNGFRIFGLGENGLFGASVSCAGDVNGDGIADVIIGAPSESYLTSANSGAFVVYGNHTFPQDLQMNKQKDNRWGYVVYGMAADDSTGWVVRSAGDVNGDGFSDILIGAPNADPLGQTSGGYAVLLRGAASGGSPTMAPTPPPATTRPTRSPTNRPTKLPSKAPTVMPTKAPTRVPSIKPTADPTFQPTRLPTSPTIVPTQKPTKEPTCAPTKLPSVSPTAKPTGAPTFQPTIMPSMPTATPTLKPTRIPTIAATKSPSREPTTKPTTKPTAPTAMPTPLPTMPTAVPTCKPTAAPTVAPTLVPGQVNLAPTSQPSGQPSQLPTAFPSITPSCFPTSQPSKQPNCAPTAVPSSQPSGQPSLRPRSSSHIDVPTGQPSANPSAWPSAQPVTLPSAQPTCLPTSQPSAQPSCQPSGRPRSPFVNAPSSQPTTEPSSQPSGQPSTQPSGQPYCAPTAQPSIQPSGQPSGRPRSFSDINLPSSQPSNRPSAQPSSRPSNQPSCYPSVQPSDQPSDQPTSRPLAVPTGRPSSQPTRQPTLQPTGQPSSRLPGLSGSDPSSQPTEAPISDPTTQPSSCPSTQPSRLPSVLPSVQPSTQPSTHPSAQPSAQPSSAPTCRPISRPPVDSARPSPKPTASPTVNPSRSPTAQFSTAPTISSAPPAVSIRSVQSFRNSLTAFVHMIGGTGAYVYCAAFRSLGYHLVSTAEVKTANSALYMLPGIAALNVTGLSAATNYSMFCTVVTTAGAEMSLEDVKSTYTAARTACCKSLTVEVLLMTLFPGDFKQRAVLVTSKDGPSSDLVVSVLLRSLNSTSSADAPSTIFPPAVAIKAASSGKQDLQYFAVVAGAVGTYEIELSLGGQAAGEYTVKFTSGRTMRVLSREAEPHAPVLLQANFASDGASVTLSFDSATDRAGYRTAFPCPALLTFTGVGYAVCEWQGDSRVNIYPQYKVKEPDNILRVGSPLHLRSDLLRAACTRVNASECRSWRTAEPAVVNVAAPLTPTFPSVSFSLPAKIGGCSPLTVDLASSTGAAGRPWDSVRFTVLTGSGATSAAIELQRYLQRNFTFSPPTMVPYSSFRKGFTYSIEARLCNFFGACSNAVRSVAVLESETAYPLVSIVGTAAKTLYRKDQLTLKANAYTQSCNGSVSFRNLDFAWSIRARAANGTFVATALRSSSQSPAVLKLLPYALDVATTYKVTLTVTSLMTSLRSSAETTVTVLQSSLVAKISGGSTKYALVGDELTVDASQSYDEDRRTSGGLVGASFQWSCVQLQPSFSSNCPLEVVSHLAAPQLNLTMPLTAVNMTSQFTVTVSDATRSAQAQVLIIVTGSPTPRLDITSDLPTLSNVNTLKRLVLYGTLELFAPCTATWAVDDPSILLADISSTPTSKSLQPIAQVAQPFNLVLNAGGLPQRSTFVLSLACGTVATSVTITTNGAPLPGEYLIAPPSGTELSTVFKYSAQQWSDPDLPLTYQFGFQSAASLSNLVIVSKEERSYAESSLPAGATEAGNVVICTLRVYDSFEAFVDVEKGVVVDGLDDTQRNEELLKVLGSGTGSTDSTKSILAVVGAALNSVNCTLTINCTDVNRHPCAKTSGECGACLPGYIGDGGDRSSPCIPAAELASHNATSALGACQSDADCTFAWQQCDLLSGNCTVPSKSCGKNCSHHGSCIFLNTFTAARLDTCLLDDSTCEGVCDCTIPYSGKFCEMSEELLLGRRRLRSDLIGKLHHLTGVDDVSAETVSAWSGNLYSLSTQPHELSSKDSIAVAAIANITLMNALKFGADSYESMKGVLQATDAVASVLSVNYNPNYYDGDEIISTEKLDNNTADSIINTVQLFADLVTRTIVLGQNETVFLYDNFRMSVAVNALDSTGASNLTLTSAQTEYERLSNAKPAAVSLAPVNGRQAHGAVATKIIAVYPRSYSADVSAFVSNPLMLQVQSTGDHSVSASEYLSAIEFTFPNNEAQPKYMASPRVNFTTICTSRDQDDASFVCPESGAVLHHNCSQGAGVQVSYCPKPAPGCAKLAVSSAAVSFPDTCHVVRYDALSATCVCKLRGTRERRQLTTTEQDLLDDSGVTNMMTSTVFIADDFADTFTVADDFNSPSDASRVLVVIIMMSVIWIPGLLGVAVDALWTKTNKAKKKVAPGEPGTASEGKQVILDYLNKVIPEVFSSSDKSPIARLVSEVVRHHSIFQVFSLQSKRKRREVVGKALTLLTFMLFLTAVFFDVSNPGDDGTCVNYTNEADCLKRISPFDNSLTYCKWSVVGSDTSEDAECIYNTATTSVTALFYLTVLTTVLTAIATIPLDYLYGIISSPTAKSLKGSKMMKTISLVAAGARRLSNVTAASAAAAVDAARGKTSRKGGDVIIANREIPEEIEAAGEAARSSITRLLKDNTTRMAVQRAVSCKVMRERSTRRSTSFASLSKADQVRPGATTTTKGAASHQSLPPPASGALTVLEDVIRQRLLMNDGADETVVFDSQWGVIQSFGDPPYALLDSAKSAIAADVVFAESEVHTLSENLKNYPVSHAGLEILHLFMVDLLGRNTAAAKIFQEKFGEEFGQSQVVVMAQKIAAVLVLLTLNAFFAYYVMLKAFQKGVEWQFQFLLCCIVQFAIELFIFETTECVWLNFAVPTFVNTEVKEAVRKLMEHVDSVTVTNGPVRQVADFSGEHFSLDAPAHLFVSVKLAKAYPDLLESMIVGSYTHHLPGEICRTWPHYMKTAASEPTTDVSVFTPRSLVPRALIRGATLSVQMFITIPYLYQRVIIRFVQPMILSGISIVWYAAIKSTASLIVLGSLFGLGVLYAVYRRYGSSMRARRTQTTVDVDPSAQDAHAVAIDIHPIPTFIRFDTDDASDVDDGEVSGHQAPLRSPSDRSALDVQSSASASTVESQRVLTRPPSQRALSAPNEERPATAEKVFSRLPSQAALLPVQTEVDRHADAQAAAPAAAARPQLARQNSWAGSDYSADTDEIERMMADSDIESSDHVESIELDRPQHCLQEAAAHKEPSGAGSSTGQKRTVTIESKDTSSSEGGQSNGSVSSDSTVESV